MLIANTSFKQKDEKILPFNDDFDDFYTSVNNALEQKLEAFINPAFLDIKSKNDKIFVIFELGFGLGLNFLLFANECLKYKDKKFYYIGYEKYYHNIEFLKKSWEIFGLTSSVIPTFTKLYPMPRHGIYRIVYKNITLDLVYGEEFLKDYDFVADYVFVDGFKSNTNPSFYESIFIQNIQPFLRFHTKLFSYASNSGFKNALKDNGFAVESVKSLYKRENIQAIYQNDINDEKKDGFLSKNMKKPTKKQNIAIIGTGVSGAMMAYFLSSFGDDVCVFEENEINSGASANKIGILSSLILKKSSHMQRYYEDIYLNASRFYTNEFGVDFMGCYEYAFDEDKQKRFKDQEDNILYKINKNEAFIKNGGELEPCTLVPSIFKSLDIKINTHHKLISYKQINGGKIELLFDNGTSKIFDIVVFCSGSGSKELFKNDIKMSINQGQVTHVKQFLNTLAYSAKSYITPAKNNIQIIGATYDRIDTNTTTLSQEKLEQNNTLNIQNFINSYPHKCNIDDIQIVGHKVGNRCYSTDRFAILGGFFTKDELKKRYKALFFTKHKAHKVLPKSNVYLSIAHGSRGLASAIMGASVVASSIYGVPSGYAKSLEMQTHPARFMIRELKKS